MKKRKNVDSDSDSGSDSAPSEDNLAPTELNKCLPEEEKIDTKLIKKQTNTVIKKKDPDSAIKRAQSPMKLNKPVLQ